MAGINYPRYIEKTQNEDDDFRGKSHTKIAVSIAEHIKCKNNLRVIGLEGKWGSGKSKIIDILKKEIGKTHHIYIYDVWGHQEDSQRRAFLEELTEDLSIKHSLLPEKTTQKRFDKEEEVSWEKKLDYLLSRKSTTNKKRTPKFNIGIILFGLFIIIPTLFSLISDFTDDCTDTILLKTKSFILLLIVIIYLLYSIYERFFSTHKTWASLSSLFYFYKGNEQEDTTYQVISEVDPSVKKFKEWIHSISKKDVLKKDLIIVYDNMDRLPAEKINKIWSSIHTFFAEEIYDKINVIIPFDRVHLQEVFGGKTRTNDFINKTFSIIYRVSPPILSDWKEFFRRKYQFAFGETENNDFPIVMTIFDRLKEEFTPRDIIIFINDLVTSKRIWKDEIPLKYIAIFTLQKAELNTSNTQLLDSGYLVKLEDLFAEDNKHQNYIAAQAYSIPVEDASQIVLIRKLELILREKENKDIIEFSDYPYFIEILEEAIKGEIILDNTISTLNKLDSSKIKGIQTNERIKIIWDLLVEKMCRINIRNIDFKDNHKILLKNSSNGSKITLLKDLTHKFNTIGNLNGMDYYNGFKELEDFIGKEKIDFNIIEYIENKEVPPEIYVNYLSVAKGEHLRYKLTTDNSKLDKYFSKMFTTEKISIPSGLNLSHLSADSSFKSTQSSIEDLIRRRRLTDKNFNQILQTYKSICNKKTLNKTISIRNLYDLLEVVNKEKSGYYDLIANRLVHQDNYQKYINNKNQIREINPIPNQHNLQSSILTKLTDKTHNILLQEDNQTTIEIAKQIEYYITYEDLLLLSIEWKKPLLSAVCRELTLNDYGKKTFSITKILARFEEIKNSISMPAEELFNQLSKISEDNFEEITASNIEKDFPLELFNHTTSISNKLTDHVNKTAIEYINNNPERLLKTQWGKEDSYLYGLLYRQMRFGQLTDLPINVSNAIKLLLKEIADSKISVPQQDSKWHYFITKMEDKEIRPTIINIRDYFILNNNISFKHFVFFESLLRQYGDLTDRPSEIVRSVLEKVVSNNKCFELILLNQDYYIDIINNAGKEAKELKDNLKKRLETDSNNTKLTTFFGKIGIIQ